MMHIVKPACWEDFFYKLGTFYMLPFHLASCWICFKGRAISQLIGLVFFVFYWIHPEKWNFWGENFFIISSLLSFAR